MATTSPLSLIECRQLVRFYDTPTGRVQAVRGVDLEIGKGIMTAIKGPSGSGKSTLLRMVSGLDEPTAGTVTLAGVDLYELRRSARARKRGELLTYVHQRPSDNLLSHLTAKQQLTRRERKPHGLRATEALELMGIGSRSSNLPAALSGGEQQRLAFARALVAGHEIVIADEPTSQLDSPSAAAVLGAMRRMTDAGVTILMATHDPRVLEDVDHVVTLRDGAIAGVAEFGTELVVIDQSGRVQLPPEILARFDRRRAKLIWNDAEQRAELSKP